MMPGTYDLELYRGDSYGWRFVLYEDDEKTVQTDLTGAIVASQIRDKPSGAKVVSLNCIVTLPNLVEVTMTPAMYVSCPPKGVWDLEITYADGQVQTVLAGKVTVTADVTASV